MAILRNILLFFAVVCVLICAVNDAVQKSLLSLLLDCILVGGLISLVYANKPLFLLKIGCSLAIIAGIVFGGTSLQSYLLFIPALVTLSSGCIGFIRCKTSKRNWILYIIFTLSVFCASRSFWVHQIYSHFTPNSVAVLEQGKWGNALNYEENLSITSQYSYNFLHDFIDAKKITSLQEINDYSELWLITPTKPFNLDEINTITSWVKKGGRLVIVTDHTDLFGHASAINPLLQRFDVEAQKDVILDSSGDGGTFNSFLTTFRGLSANSFRGAGETWLYQIGFSERTDYSKRSFFSDNQISDEESADCYSIGARTPFGLGGVIVFGDSTLLANFALSRPSAQAILLKMIRGGGAFSCYGVAFLFCIASIVACVKIPSTVKCIGGAFILVLLITCLLFVQSNRTLNTSNIQTVKVSGDWSLVEGNHAPLITLFSAAYVSSPYFPIWEGKSESNRAITVGDTLIREKDFFSPNINTDISLREIISSPPTTDASSMLSESIKTSEFSSYWFDDGVGLVRELAYKLFWSETLQRNTTYSLTVEPPTYINAQIKTKGEDVFEAKVAIMPIKQDKRWVILGDGLIGKYVYDDTILVRGIWQLSSRKVPDFYCRVSPVAENN